MVRTLACVLHCKTTLYLLASFDTNTLHTTLHTCWSRCQWTYYTLHDTPAGHAVLAFFETNTLHTTLHTSLHTRRHTTLHTTLHITLHTTWHTTWHTCWTRCTCLHLLTQTHYTPHDTPAGHAVNKHATHHTHTCWTRCTCLHLLTQTHCTPHYTPAAALLLELPVLH